MAPTVDPDVRRYAAVIGDVVGSRRTPDPERLRTRLRDALERAEQRVRALQPLQPTIGDEFQGVYRTVGDALNATLLVRLLLHDVAQIRFGVGWGRFTAWNPERVPYEQDGPAWWAAREAVDAAREQEHQVGGPEGWFTAVRLSTGEAARREHPISAEPPTRLLTGEFADAQPPVSLDGQALLDGLVMFRDHVVSMLDQRDVHLVLALLDGASATEAAGQAGISQQAASRRLRANGGYSLLRSWRLLEGVG